MVEKYDFDEVINRIGTQCGKWDLLPQLFNLDPHDAIPMGVADMDFRPPQAVSDALQGMLDHGIYGYYGARDSYHAAIVNWQQRHHGWTIDPSWIFEAHGLVNGTALCVDAFTEPGDGVILFTPVYYVFYRVLNAANRQVVESPLVNVEGRYEMDLDALEASLTGNEKMIVFCSPHNPGGRVWSVEELRALCDFCIKHDLILVSDEVHQDLVYPGHKHTPMPLVSRDITSRVVTMNAGTKTFNMAGAHLGNVIIEDEQLREKFAARINGLSISPGSFGMVMTEAAYNGGDEWLRQLIAYLDDNRRYFDSRVAGIPVLKSMQLEGTYLAWVDFSGAGMSRQEYTDRVQKTARIATNHGPPFGKGGEDYLRFNFALPRTLLLEAADRLEDAFSDLQ
ncbi:MAG: MalY/PatB family protein [Rhizobiaceae bacterium]